MFTETLRNLFDNFNAKRVTVMGLGHFGGQIAAIQFLVEQGARVTVTDQADAESLAASVQQIEHLELSGLHLGGHHASDFENADLILASPAVPPHNPFLQSARKQNIPIASEISLFWHFNPAKVIGVSGTIGKSTTTSMIASMLHQEKSRPIWMGGNIGNSLLPDLLNIKPDDWVILELSSFQLYYLDQLRVSPHIAILTNYHPHHLDWHASAADYLLAKQTLFRWQSKADFAIMPTPFQNDTGWQTEASIVSLDDLILNEYSLDHLTGCHNLDNARHAAAAATAAGLKPEQIHCGLRNYRVLPHRLQLVAKQNGLSFINDSKSTSALATRAAIEALDQPIVLLMGGVLNEQDHPELLSSINHNVKAVACLGSAGPVLAEKLKKQMNRPIHVAMNLQEAFDWSLKQCITGDAVLLSPGCASYDWFTNYEQRGEQFIELVQQFTSS